jgi:hypothetical protein
MRTTVTLDDDVERLLRDAMHRSRKSFKQTLNAAIRAGLAQSAPAKRNRRFVVTPKPLGLRAGLDRASLNRLADDLEIDASLETKRAGKAR